MAEAASRDGTRRFRERIAGTVLPQHYRSAFGDLTVSSIGVGTYLGEPDDATDAAYGEAMVAALALGANLLDTAINYRAQRSERVIGLALKALIEAGELRRDEVVVCTKGGYLPSTATTPPTPARYFQETYVRPGSRPADLVAGSHSLAPRYLLDQIDRSLRNLRLETIDVYYLHNPEAQLTPVDRTTFHTRTTARSSSWNAVDQGKIGCYGVATWNGFRVAPDAREYVALADFVAIAAREVGKGAHHFPRRPTALQPGDAGGVHAREPARRRSLRLARGGGGAARHHGRRERIAAARAARASPAGAARTGDGRPRQRRATRPPVRPLLARHHHRAHRDATARARRGESRRRAPRAGEPRRIPAIVLGA